MHMDLSHVRHTYFMTNKFTKSIRQKGDIGQTVANVSALRRESRSDRYCNMIMTSNAAWF